MILVMLHPIAYTQVHGGIEQYYYYSGSGPSTIVPRAYYQSTKNWYAEVRYNYEELETFSVNGGRTFSKEGRISYSVTPVAGLVFGRINGGSIGSNINAEYRDLFFSSELQYTFSIEDRAADFFFNWSELGYQVTGLVYAGFALQFTHPYETSNSLEPGVMVGFTFKNWSFPVYLFNPGSNNRNFVLGINWEWKHAPG